MTSEQRAMIAELLAEIGPHVRRIEAVGKTLQGPARDALDQYGAAAVQAMLELQRERLAVRK
jgi:hypothetical protein